MSSDQRFRGRFRGEGLLIPTAQRIGGSSRAAVRVAFHRATNRLRMRLPSGKLREIGRFGEEEARGAPGDLFAITRSGKGRAGTMADAWRAHSRSAVAWDDFPGLQAAPDKQQLPWTSITIGSDPGTLSKRHDASAGQRGKAYGIVRLTTAATSGTGRALALGDGTTNHGYQRLPAYSWGVAKARLTGSVTDLDAWIGIFDDPAVFPDGGLSNTVSGVGFTARAAGSGVNWKGIVRSGTTETLVDLGVAADATWRELGFLWAPGDHIHFYADGVEVGSKVTTNQPAAGVAANPMFAIRTAAAAAKQVELDYVGFFLNSGDRF